MSPVSGEFRASRRSRYFYPVEPELAARVRAVSFEGYYTTMLYQDLEFVMPFDVGRASGATARLTGRDSVSAESMITQALSTNEHTYWLTDALERFVRSAAQNLVLAGPVTYEINYLYPVEGESAAEPMRFRLELIAPGTMSYHGTTPIQYVLSTFGGPTDSTGLTYVELDPQTLVTFHLPDPIEDQVKKIIHFLRAANREQVSGSALLDQSMRGKSGYSFTRHQEELAELFAAATAPIGWNARGLFTYNHLEPYDVWRELKFMEFKTRVRQAILHQLNDVLAQIGSVLRFEAQIELVGVVALSDIEQAMEDMRSGARSIGQLARFAAS